MPTEILNLEEEIIRDEEFIQSMNDQHLSSGRDCSCRSLSEIVDEITASLSININL
tara:strand:- start:341 stop:508 length:168 start_codon:yes stop_codon:yes gene_type:complete